ncbi:MAG: hypothetical protein FJ358_00875 [Thaumarchaeota archaeon]|nr:hypothetical protein [Nitrososphaerota archaeon]
MAKQKVATIRLLLTKKPKGKKNPKSNSEWEVRLWEMLHKTGIHALWGIDSIAVKDEEEIEE